MITMEKQCLITEVFAGDFIELLKLAPRNPLVRALILRFTGKQPPAECVTYEQLQEWVETHCEKRKVKGSAGGEGIRINVEFSETEYGRADYSVPRWGTAEFHLPADELSELISDIIEDGGGLEELVQAVASRIDDDAWSQCEPDMDNYGDYSYSDHESGDSGDGNTDYSKDDIRQALRRYVRERHPELADQL